MDIEDIINNARFAKPESRSLRSGSICESTDTSNVSEIRSSPESVSSCLEAVSSHESARHESSALLHCPHGLQSQSPADSHVRLAHSLAQRQQSTTTSSDYDGWEVPQQLSGQQMRHSIPVLHGQATQPLYYPACMILPMHPSSVPHMAPLSQTSSTLQVQNQSLQQPQPSHAEPPHPSHKTTRGVRLPPLPESLRRAQTTSTKKHPLRPKEKRTRIRPAPVIHDYGHLSTKEAIQELARRNIHLTSTQQGEITNSSLVQLLQRADRNNNKGSHSQSESVGATKPA